MLPADLPSALSEKADEELMALVAAGGRAAYAELVRRHERRVRGYCARWCGDTALADDLAQEAFLDLWRGRERYRPSGRFAAYLFTLVRNRCRNVSRLCRPLPLGLEPAATQDDQLAALLSRESRRRLESEVQLLPPKLREAVLLRFQAGLDYEDMARVLGRPAATVRGRIFQALVELRRKLREVSS